MLFSIYDTKSELYGPLFEAETPEAARRFIFQTLLRDETSTLSMFSGDFTLNCLGDYFRDTGKVYPVDNISVVCVVSDVKKDVDFYLMSRRNSLLEGGDGSNDDIVEASSNS